MLSNAMMRLLPTYQILYACVVLLGVTLIFHLSRSLEVVAIGKNETSIKQQLFASELPRLPANAVPLAAHCLPLLRSVPYCQYDAQSATTSMNTPDPRSAQQQIDNNSANRDRTKKLLQQLHLEQALAEECLQASKIQVDHKNAREYLNDSCEIGVVFPRSLVSSCFNGAWDFNKTISYFFAGTIPPHRSWVKKYQTFPDAKIESHPQGRDILKKTGSYDTDYYENLKRSSYALAPAGDFQWTYRFLEAVMCGSVPVVEDATIPQVVGYHVCELGKPCIYQGDLLRQAALENLRVFLPRHSLILEDQAESLTSMATIDMNSHE